MLQRSCTWYPLRRRLSAIASSGKPGFESATSGDAVRLGQELERDGVAMLPAFLDTDAVRRICDHLVGAGLRERFPPFRGGFTLDTVPENVHVAEYATEHILKCPDVMAIANHPLLLATAARYLGCKPTISNLSIWWSLPADGKAQEAENFHRDVDDWRFVKLFVYLNDVDADGGPHCFVRGSHRSWHFLRKRRLDDSEVEAVFPKEDMLQIGGRTGDAFLEDTFGLHKGQPPRLRRRLLLQVEYSVNPIAVYEYRPATVKVGGRELDPYINRLYVSLKAQP
jgi:phytanoyl-CoA dioxygenase PhyH